MAKKKKKQKPKQGHPARLQEGVVSMDRVKVERGVDALTPEFVRWYEEYRDDPELALMVLATIRETLGIYADVVGLNRVTDFEPPQLLAVLKSMLEFEEAESPEASSGELRALVFMAWVDYVEFLRDNDLWERENESLDWLQRSLEIQDPFSAERGTEPLDDPIEFDAALVEIIDLPIAKLGRAVLTWIAGHGKQHWRTELDREFATAAEAAVREDLPAGLDEERRLQLVALSAAALAACGAVDLVSQKAPALGPTYQEILKPRGAQAFEANYAYLQTCLDLLLEAPEQADEQSLESWGLANLWILEAIEGNAHQVSAERGEKWSRAAWGGAHQRMSELRELGLVEEGDYYTLPRIVSFALSDTDDAEMDEEEFDEQQLDALFGPGDFEEPKRLARTKPYSGKVLQLKLGLQDTKPPIWRRVLVPMDLNLGDLHDIIQASFDWYDGHLHQFRAGGYGGTTYGPAIEDMEYAKDESEVLISELLAAEKDRLDYDYDFGDGWEIRIDVEKVLDTDDGQLPRCTGGRRMAPLEDSGGTWGWAAKLEILEDPKHEEHEEVRDWLEGFGYDSAEQLDPASFSIEQINEGLGSEF